MYFIIAAIKVEDSKKLDKRIASPLIRAILLIGNYIDDLSKYLPAQTLKKKAGEGSVR